ncbi:MAG: hypothetical protein WCV88_01175 [Patescibacteria group bacterium]|jgi:hypothetical protein
MTVVNLTPNIIGVSESVYKELLNSHCYTANENVPSDAVTTPLGRLCDPILNILEGKVILRAQHSGKMYWINTANGLPIINRYLPDGFYKVKNRYYWIADGFKQKLSSKNIYSAFLEAAAVGDFRVTPASNLDIQALACLDFGEGPTCSSIISGHEELYEDLQQRLIGRVIMAVESDGELYFIPDINEIDELTYMSNDQLLVYIQNHSIAVNRKIIRGIPKPL